MKFQRLPHRLSTLIVMALTLATASYGSTSQLHAQIKAPGKQDSGELGLDAQTLEAIPPLIHNALQNGQMAGAVVCIGRRDGIAYFEAFGDRQVEPTPKPMTTTTLFDLASLTKPLATGLSVMKLVEEGRVRLRDPVRLYLPEFGQNGKESVTILQLLTHQGGLIPDNALADYEDGVEKAWQRIYELPLSTPAGTQFKYTDVGFLVLGKVVEKVSGLALDDYTQRHLYDVLELESTGFKPRTDLKKNAAATEMRNGQWIVGEVHDPRSYLLDGVAGHAGLFSTAGDLSIICRMILNQGQWKEKRILSPATIRRMSVPEHLPKQQIRGLGWDKLSVYSSNRGEYFSPEAIGHGGFTGTSLWVDPALDLFVIFLSNRLHPDGKGSVNRVAGAIGTIAAASLDPETLKLKNDQPVMTKVKTGADILAETNFKALRGKRVGLITNHTGQTRDGISLVQLMKDSENVDLHAIFSPEHGFKGELDQKQIDDQRDPISGLKIFSLYGKTRRPTPEMLEGLDTLVFDIQDIGTRFYTYISTMGLAMEAAAEQNIEFLVLDRPNPLGGKDVRGPILDADKESFVGYHTIAVQHGMTVGELSLLFREERRMNLKLDVVRCENWEGRQSLEKTGLPWTSPSPNMRRLNAARLYPGIGLMEMTNLSVGRGTDTPFEWIGAPWIDGVALSAHLNRQGLSGVAFVPVRFTPESSKYQGVECQGTSFIITQHEALNALQLGWTVATALRDLYTDAWESENYARLLGNVEIFEAFRGGSTSAELQELCAEQLVGFRERRAKHLLYGRRAQ